MLDGFQAEARRGGQDAGHSGSVAFRLHPPTPRPTLSPNKGMCFEGDCKAPGSRSSFCSFFLSLTQTALRSLSLPSFPINPSGCACLGSQEPLIYSYPSFLLFEILGPQDLGMCQTYSYFCMPVCILRHRKLLGLDAQHK